MPYIQTILQHLQSPFALTCYRILAGERLNADGGNDRAFTGTQWPYGFRPEALYSRTAAAFSGLTEDLLAAGLATELLMLKQILFLVDILGQGTSCSASAWSWSCREERDRGTQAQTGTGSDLTHGHNAA